jgi:DNA-binding transcriptional ArsR family regulator
VTFGTVNRVELQGSVRAEADVAGAAALFADPSRARVLMGLADGRALPATVLAAEAGVSPQAMSSHLAKLTSAGLVRVERSGRYRYYALAGPHVGEVLEALALVAQPQPVTSLRQGTRVQRLRAARTCYDHLAGQLGVAVTQALIDRAVLVPLDGIGDGSRRAGDGLSARLPRHPYRLGDAATGVLAGLGVDLNEIAQRPSGRARPLLKMCLDWTEQRHHLSGALGAALMAAFVRAGWVVHRRAPREVELTRTGAVMLRDHLGVAAAQALRGGGTR